MPFSALRGPGCEATAGRHQDRDRDREFDDVENRSGEWLKDEISYVSSVLFFLLLFDPRYKRDLSMESDVE